MPVTPGRWGAAVWPRNRFGAENRIEEEEARDLEEVARPGKAGRANEAFQKRVNGE
jgi:hypothetical protein